MKREYSIFVGDVALDEYYKAPYWPNISEKLIVETLKPNIGGMIANAASVYAGYGESTFFVSLLNSGKVTRKLLKNLDEGGIDTRYILYDDNLPDSKTIVFLTENDHTIFIPNLGINYIDITPEVFEAIKGAKLIYTTIMEIKRLRYNQLEAIDIIKEARSLGTRFVCDLDVAHLEPGDEKYIKEMDIVFFNQMGFRVYQKGTSYEKAILKLLEYGIEIVAVTMGANGANIHTREKKIHVPGIPVEVVDVTGAGDTFCSSFIYAMSKSSNLYTVSNFANAAASRAVTRMGPRGGVTKSKSVIDFMKEKGLEVGEEYQSFLESR
ncbi:carbohydrate kinase family protein [Virgibacillus necropolis]|uniref:Carbohydrate kinase PfkB domain-containing protein n=1 Tax=Virgibacillus necropolis TaxID=163877 RepID=A0A221M9G1_9BACI|nr:carbohydrate kinase family protein [Virgibacillus necropolis]ASN04261.1 hypothetical protein CFK40_04175 [Virgibacillus necropolis]